MNVTVIGSGSWGTALGAVLADNGHSVILLGRNQAEVEDVNRHRKNSRYFGEVLLPEGLRATVRAEDTAGYDDMLVIAVPSAAFPSIYPTVRPLLSPHTVVVNAAKGFEPGSGKRLSVALREAFADRPFRGVASLIGPSHAEEVVRRMLTAVTAVSADRTLAEEVQRAFSGDYLRVYVTEDERGAEYGAAVKNVVALASGMLEGCGFGDNAKAALITRGLVEAVRYGEAMGAERDTFFGLSGVGDLIVTCFSPHSRNYRAGLVIGRANSGEAIRDLDLTVEGIAACREVAADARRRGIEMPIVLAVHAVLFEGVRPAEAIAALMHRPLRAE